MIAALLIAGALLSAYASGSSGGGFVHGVLMRGQVVRAAKEASEYADLSGLVA